MAEEAFLPHLLADLCRKGNEQAAKQLFDTYTERLIALARRRISQRLTCRVDPEDIVQSVFRTFFGRLKAGQFEITDQDNLCKLLMRITVHKTLRQVAFHKAAKRDPNQEMGQQDSAVDQVRELLDREPTAEATVAFVDQLEHFLARLGVEERQVLEMRLQGYANEEIASKLGIYDRKIRRIVERIRGLAELEGLSALAGARRASAREEAARSKSDEESKSAVMPAPEAANGEARAGDVPPTKP